MQQFSRASIAVSAVAALLYSSIVFQCVAFTARNCSGNDTSECRPSVGDPSATVQPEGSDLRLPTDVIPLHYNLTLAPYLYGEDLEGFYFTGSVAISVMVLRNANSFKLHTKELSLTPPWILDSEGLENVSVKSIDADEARQLHTFTLTEPLKAGSNYTIVIDRFRGAIKSDQTGLYLNTYTANGDVRTLVTSQLQATDARKVFPCFDEPAFKATFDVSLVRRSDFKAISNMPSKAVFAVSAADWFNNTTTASFEREDFETTPVMSTYLLAFVVSQFDSVSQMDHMGRDYRNWIRPKYANMTGYALSAVINIVNFFETYFRVAYPLNKTDQAIVVHRYGAMENWGLIIYAESDLVLNSELDTASHLQGIDYLVSHELAHMWFGNLVTMKWWNEIWLNEGFATFVARLGIHFLHPWCEMDSQFVVNEQAQAFRIDSSPGSHPIYMDVYSPDQVDTVFDSITYNKGATVLRMMYNFIGDDVFRKGVGTYLRSNSYKNTLDTALYQSLTRQVAIGGRYLDVGEVMDPWINQMGYPVLHCNRTNDTLSLQQEHFVMSTSAHNFTWIIPITAMTMENASNWNGSEVWHLTNWMRARRQKFALQGTGWYLLNLRSTAFYRVNYDANNWKALTNQLHTDHTIFSPQDRARLLDDAFSLARVEMLDPAIAFRLADYLRRERHLVPWKAAMWFLDRLEYTVGQDKFGPEIASAYVRALIRPVYESIRLEAAPGSNDLHLTKLLRQLISDAAHKHGLRQFKADAGALFDRFVRSNFTAALLPPDTRYAILCEGLTSATHRLRRRIRELEGTVLSLTFDRDVWLANNCRDDYRRRRRRRLRAARSTAEHSAMTRRMRESLARMRVA